MLLILAVAHPQDTEEAPESKSWFVSYCTNASANDSNCDSDAETPTA